MNGGIDHHGRCIGILTGDFFIHLEEIAVFGRNPILSFPLDGVPEIQIYRQAGFPYPFAQVALFLGVSGRHVPGNQIAETRVFAFQVIVPLGFGDGFRGTLVAGFCRHPHPAVVSQAFAHQRQFGLIASVNRDAGRVNLGEAGIGKIRPLFIGPQNRRHIRRHGIGGQAEHIAVAAGGQHHGVSCMRLNAAVN